MFVLPMICATGCTISLMISAWNYGTNNVIITNIETLQYPLWNLTHPAVYICNLNKISLKAVDRVVNQWILPYNMSKEEVMEELKTLPLFAFKMTKANNYDIVYKILTLNNVSLLPLMNELTEPCSALLKHCKWRSKEYKCDTLISKVITLDGYCCAFNSLFYKNFSKPFKWKKARRATTTGYSNSFSVTLKTNKSDYFSSISASYGYSVNLKNPFLYPDSTLVKRTMPFNSVFLVSFSPIKIFSTSEVIDLKEECLSTGNRYLAGFQAYSFHNCMVECKTNLTVRMCGCVPIVYPMTGDNQRYCEIGDIGCLHKHKALFQSLYGGLLLNKYQEYGTEEIFDIDQSFAKNRPCNCIPECSITTFEADSNYSPLMPSKNRNNRLNLLYVFTDNAVSMRIRRDTFITWRVLLGIYGGLLGFFLGMSIICVPELIFFLILHPLFARLRRNLFKNYCNLRNKSFSAISNIGSKNKNASLYYQSNAERYNCRLRRILYKKNFKIPLQRHIHQDWIN
ncbi:sodium channel protein Nach-like [Lycorma delicatula]|uniref:sodium channel protein Nach-like n=1 Tax=Lycorma delicatula TaxID=130591 RepID=UPI003F5119F5